MPTGSNPSQGGRPRLCVAFIGFQHPHIWGLFALAGAHPEIEIVACCEEDPAMRETLARGGKVRITHDDYRRMLAEVPLDGVIVCDWFGKRGGIIIDCLQAGRHVLTDKPMCTSLAEYEEIARLAAARRLAVGMMLDLRDSGNFRRARELVRAGDIGELRAVSLGGQHPLLPGVRPAWYHEAGKHGGTINDLGVHALDLVPWVTGVGLRRVIAARTWKSGVPADSHFANAAQVVLEMDNGAGLMTDLSYLAPDSQGYTLPYYWRMTLWGSRGVLEAGLNLPAITVHAEGEKTGRSVPPAEPGVAGYLDSFLRELRGQPGATLTGQEILRTSWVSLRAQAAADRGEANVAL